MRILLDASVVCDALFEREPWKAEAKIILARARDRKLVGVVSSLTVANVYCIGRKLFGRARAASTVRECLDALEIRGVDHDTIASALARNGSDFEDDIQLVVAMTAKVDGIVSRDASGFRSSPIPILTPFELVQQVQSEQP